MTITGQNLFSNRCLLAIAAVVDIALHARPMPVDVKSIEGRLRLPPRHLETLLRALVRAKILNSACGPSGGYRLARGSRLISAGEIVRTCTVKKAPDASRLISKVVEASLQKAGESAMANLDTITIEDICYQAAAVGIKENDEIPLGLKKAKP